MRCSRSAPQQRAHARLIGRLGVDRLIALSLLLAMAAAAPVVAGDAPAAAAAHPAAVLAKPSLSAPAAVVAGAAIFAAPWLPAPDVSDGADGLGPLHNATSCADCHPGPHMRPAAVSAAEANPSRAPAVARVLRLAVAAAPAEVLQDAPPVAPVVPQPDPLYGLQLQDRAIAGHAPEGRLALDWEEHRVVLADASEVALRRPRVRLADPAYGPPSAHLVLSLRRPPPLDGLGLVARIPDPEIAAAADPEDSDGDGISGRFGRAIDPVSGEPRLARFGWKAAAVSLEHQSAIAFRLDMGLSSPLAPGGAGDCTPAQDRCRAAPDGASAAKGGYEVSARELALVAAYVGSLPPPEPSPRSTRALPPSATPAAAATLPVRQVFWALGCAACHRPSMSTTTPTTPGATPASTAADSAAAAPAAAQFAPLYSDLLLHDMGPDLADGMAEGSASGAEWRTAPLWGLGRRLAEIAAGDIDGLLHDGRARTIEEAILWHGGEAKSARDRYAASSSASRSALIAFLAGL